MVFQRSVQLLIGIPMNDGKDLEALVEFVESRMLPQGFKVKTNQRIYNEDGTQIAEFDIEIRGRLGTTQIAWLIECRDRPSAGKAPASWVEQLVARRSRFGFNKVTAVSTTGFADGAQQYATQSGIELRVVESLSPDAFCWLRIEYISIVELGTNLENATILVKENISEELSTSLKNILVNTNGKTEILRSIKTGEHQSLANAFLAAVNHGKLFDGIDPCMDGKKITLRAEYVSDDDHFVIGTDHGDIRVHAIDFYGSLTAVETLAPIVATKKYDNLETGETISQVVKFAPHDINGDRMAFEIHRMGEDGETYLTLRNLKSSS